MASIRPLSVVEANRGPLIVSSGFKGYDVCLNTYVGCQIGCAYCYVRWFNLDKNHNWGEFVRIRAHIQDKLPIELSKGYVKVPDGKRLKVIEGKPVMNKNGKQVKETLHRTISNKNTRLVIGTLTDPYQPLERKYRITRCALQAILGAERPLNKVGIFTRSPIVLDDLDLIVQLPRKRVHYTVTPLSPELMRLLEPISIRTDRRFDTIRKLKAAGVRVHVNVAPAIPTISEQFTAEYAKTLAEIGVDEWFTDPMQAYGESWDAMRTALNGHPAWPGIEEIMSDSAAYAEWKEAYKISWMEAWAKVRHKSPHTLPIWSDHQSKTWVDLRTNQPMDIRRYGDDLW